MKEEQKKLTYLKGSEFLTKDSQPEDIFIPEDFTEEQSAMYDAMNQFLEQEIWPRLDEIDEKKNEVMQPILDKAAELGFLGPSIPFGYDGLDLDYTSVTLLAEAAGAGYSFGPALLAHTGIGTLPILYFGTEEQKKKYLPKLAKGEYIGCYCLTEPGSGSDALSAKTKATLSSDGKYYILNGEKIWITNGGMAGIFIVFAQVDGDKFTGFIAEKGFEGLSVGEELQKMGIKGSSTVPVYFDECKIPKENVLGEIGKGHQIAFNILNDGRLKLGSATVGAAKRTAELAQNYAKERIQFGKPIAAFGAIQHKLAAQIIRIYAIESALYRTAQYTKNMEGSLLSKGKNKGEALLGASREYAVESAIMKVMGSEMLDFVIDEGVQIYGGYGFSEEYPMARIYRDSRINRLFEGTNEINRLLTVDMLMKRALKGELDLLGPAKKIRKELTSMPQPENIEGPLAEERKGVKNMKKAFLMVAGAAAQEAGEKLEEEEEVVMNIADMLMETYLAESALLRTLKLTERQGADKSGHQVNMTKVIVRTSLEKIGISGREAVSGFAGGDLLRILYLGLKRFTRIEPENLKELRRKVARKALNWNE